MNIVENSKQTAVRHPRELVRHFRQLAGADPDLRWGVPPASAQGIPSQVKLRLDDRLLRFKPVFQLRPGVPELATLAAGWHEADGLLLIVPELSDRVLELCRKKQLATLDLNGRVYIRAPGVLVDRGPLPGRRFRFQLAPRDIFTGKSERIIRTLLTDRDRLWRQRELIQRSQASSGLVSRIVQHLIQEGYLEKRGAREFRLREPVSLLDAWTKADDFARRTSTTRYSVFGNEPLAVARQLHAWAVRACLPIAFTQWVAAWLRHPFAEPVVVSAYAARLPEAKALAGLGLRPVEEAGQVWLHIPNDDGVFLETQIRQGLPLASDAQIYLDLQSTGLRGPEAAAVLRNGEGFCRP